MKSLRKQNGVHGDGVSPFGDPLRTPRGLSWSGWRSCSNESDKQRTFGASAMRVGASDTGRDHGLGSFLPDGSQIECS